MLYTTELFAPLEQARPRQRRTPNEPIVGLRFGRLTVTAEAPRQNNYRHAVCCCDCGVVKTVSLANLRKGTTKSCGCLRVDAVKAAHRVHGHISQVTGASPTYNAWRVLLRNAKRDGHAVCDEWRQFAKFLADMGVKPEGEMLRLREGATHYNKDNCIWIVR